MEEFGPSPILAAYEKAAKDIMERAKDLPPYHKRLYGKALADKKKAAEMEFYRLQEEKDAQERLAHDVDTLGMF